MSFTKKVSNEFSGLKPTKELFKELNAFAASNLLDAGNGRDPNNQLFNAVHFQIVSKSNAEALFIDKPETSTLYKSLSVIADHHIEHCNGDIAEARKRMLLDISESSKGFIQTAHPSFAIVKGGLEAAKRYQEVLKRPNFVKYLSGKLAFDEIPQEDKELLKKVNLRLYDSVTNYPKRALNTKEESVMLTKQTENIFDSFPVLVDFFNKLFVEKFGGELKPSEYQYLDNFVKQYRWYDQDSKPDNTAIRISEANEKTSVIGMQQQYVLQLANIIKDIPDEKNPVRLELERIMIKSLNRLDHEEGLDQIVKKYSDAILKNEDKNSFIQELYSKHFRKYSKFLENLSKAYTKREELGLTKDIINPESIELIKGVHVKRVEILGSEKPNKSQFGFYEEPKDAAIDLRKLVDNAEVGKQVSEKIALLATRYATFGERSSKPENRQNRKEIKKGYDYLIEKMPEGLKNGISNVSDLLDLKTSNPEKFEKIRSWTSNFLDEKEEFYNQTAIDLQSQAIHNEKRAKGIKVDEVIEISNDRRAEYLKLDVLYTSQYLSNLGSRQRSRVIAEFEHVDDFKRVVVLEDLTRELINKDKNITEIKILVENAPDIPNASNLVRGILSDTNLLAYQLKTHPKPTISDAITGEVRVKTVADLKKEKGLKVLAGDDNKELNGKIIVMFAGSDLIKGLGPAGKFMADYQKWQICKICAEFGIDVEFQNGNGTHPARNSDESFIHPIQTSQGIELNNSPSHYAYRALMHFSHKEHVKYGIEPELKKGELEYGNSKYGIPEFKCFEENPELAEKIYKQMQKAADEYIGLYERGIIKDKNVNIFNHYFEVATLKFIDEGFTSNAARPTKRVEAAAKSGVEVSTMRAIEFAHAQAAMLNHLVFQIDKMLGLSKREIKQNLKDAKTFPVLKDIFFNTCTFGVMAANVDQMWKLVDETIIRKDNGAKSSVLIGDKEYKVSHLRKIGSEHYNEIRSFFQSKFESLNNSDEMVEKHVNAVLIAANSDSKFTHAVARLGKLYKEEAFESGLIDARDYRKPTKITQDKIFDYMPSEVADYYKFVRDKSKQCLEELVPYVQKVKLGELNAPKRKDGIIIGSENLFNKIYELVGALKHFHESTPAPVESRDIVIAMNKNIQIEVAV